MNREAGVTSTAVVATTCTQCGSSDIETDHTRGSAVCTRCGYVLEDNLIISEVSFTETGNGGSNVVGQYMNAEGTKSFSMGPNGYHHGFGRDSRAITINNGRRSIAQVASSLELNTHHVEAAHRYFKLAVEHRFIQGRKTDHVVAACLYIVCRIERTHHLLLDFADVLQVNVFTLGSTYLKLCRKLSVSLPIVDPTLFIYRFAHKLEFGDKEHDVVMTALRLVSRMKRDWIQVGRRPTGICGAGLLIAARLHGFSRTQRNVIDVVRVCDATLRKRLVEFEATPSGALTASEFQAIDLEKEEDPPSFAQTRKRPRLDKAAAIEAPAASLTADIEAEMARTAQSAEFAALNDRDGSMAAAAAAAATVVAGSGAGASAHGVADSMDAKGPAADATSSSAAAFAPEPARPTAWVAPDDDGALSDLDDDEIEEFIMKLPEVETKTKMWTEANQEYISKQEEKKRALERAKELGHTKPEPKKRKRKRDKPLEPAANAEEAMQQMLSEKKVSKKINYAVLEGLDMPEATPAREAAAAE